MKKLDKLIITSFIGPLILTFCVSVFILLIQYMLKYFDDLVGKDLGYSVFAELLLYFSINMTPIALPLAILIASIMTYGNLGEHFELTAIKGSGISLTRTLLPTGILVFFISIGAFFSNNYVVPNANLRAYSLLYDIKRKKPSLDLKEGQFYEGINGYSIKIKKKYPDGVAMRDVIIYDHQGNSQGNKKVILADSCRMYTIANDRYLMMELFDGYHYSEGESRKRGVRQKIEPFSKTRFSNMKMVFSLADFDLDRTDMELFSGNKLMKSVAKLTKDIDSMKETVVLNRFQAFKTASITFKYHLRSEIDFMPEHLAAVDVAVRARAYKRDSIAMAQENNSEEVEDTLATTSQPKTPPTSTGLIEQAQKSKGSFVNEPNIDVKTNYRGVANSTLKTQPRDTSKANLNPQKRLNKKVIPEIPTANKKTKPPTRNALNETVNEEPFDWNRLIVDDSVLAALKKRIDVGTGRPKKQSVITRSVGTARNIRTNLTSKKMRIIELRKIANVHVVEKYKKYSQAVACFIMFLIGAPLGAIIKKGGLGMPVVVSIFFFIIFYVVTVISDKWAKAIVMDGMYAAWVADVVLLPFGIVFMIQAQRDAKLFDADFYNVWFQNLKVWWKNKNYLKRRTSNN